MKIQIASDLHMEFPDNRKWLQEHPLPPKADILILAGDTIPYIYQHKIPFFYDHISSNFGLTISIFGNHGFYNGIIDTAFPSYYQEIRENVLLLNNHTIHYKGVVFICSTLWSDVPEDHQEELSTTMNDFRLIKKKHTNGETTPLKVFEMVKLHQKSLAYLKKELKKYQDRPVVVVSHHVPSPSFLPEKYQNSLLRWGYSADMTDLIAQNPQILLWVCGHCHTPHHDYINDTMVIRNPFGYATYDQHKQFDPELVVEIDYENEKPDDNDEFEEQEFTRTPEFHFNK